MPNKSALERINDLCASRKAFKEDMAKIEAIMKNWVDGLIADEEALMLIIDSVNKMD